MQQPYQVHYLGKNISISLLFPAMHAIFAVLGLDSAYNAALFSPLMKGGTLMFAHHHAHLASVSAPK
jgi:hypothetical protein